MSASTGDVLYDRPFSFPSASIAFCRGRAKRDPSVGFVGNSPPVRASGLIKKYRTCRYAFFKGSIKGLRFKLQAHEQP